MLGCLLYWSLAVIDWIFDVTNAPLDGVFIT